MGRAASSIQTEITTLETYLASTASLQSNVGSNGTAIGRAERKSLQARLDSLYIQLDRANGTGNMFVRGRVKGM